jgi:NAD+ kinase
MPDVEPRAVRTAGIISKPHSDQAARLVPELVEWLETRGVAVRLDEESASYAGRATGLPRKDVPEGCDLVVVMGGDGTLLSAARAAGGRDIPLFAVNLGNLGFLTAITVAEIYPQLERALVGDFHTRRRRMLHVELWRDGHMLASHEALNDMVLAKAEIARMIELEVHADGNFVCVYRADGLIVCTPTGSTAYSISAGGPILYPTVAALSITPICPHMLSNRPVIVPDEMVIEIINQSADQSTYFTIDGQVGELLEREDRVICRRSAFCVNLVRPPGMLFFDVLREKLHWGGR